MIELNINAGEYDVVFDEPVETSAPEATEETIQEDGSKPVDGNIFALAQAIANRGYQHRRLRKSSSVI